MDKRIIQLGKDIKVELDPSLLLFNETNLSEFQEDCLYGMIILARCFVRLNI